MNKEEKEKQKKKVLMMLRHIKAYVTRIEKEINN